MRVSSTLQRRKYIIRFELNLWVRCYWIFLGSVNPNRTDEVTLTALAVLGAPALSESAEACPPSIVIGGTVRGTVNLGDEPTLSPIILVYGLCERLIETVKEGVKGIEFGSSGT